MSDQPEHETGAELAASANELAESQALRERALEACRNWIGQSHEEDGSVGGFSASEVVVSFHRQALVFAHGELDYPFVETELRLGVEPKPSSRDAVDGLVPIGSYKLITHLSGEPDDDYFVISTSRRELETQGLV